MATSSISLRTSIRTLLVLGAALGATLAVASPASANEGNQEYCGDYASLQRVYNECEEEKPPVDECPDALNPGFQNPGTPCLVEQPAPTPAPAPAPVDACPDEALNPGLQAAGTACLAELGPAAAFDDQEYATLGNAAASTDPTDPAIEYTVGGGTAVAAAAPVRYVGTLPVTGSETILASIAGVVLLWLGALSYLGAATVRRGARNAA